MDESKSSNKCSAMSITKHILLHSVRLALFNVYLNWENSSVDIIKATDPIRNAAHVLTFVARRTPWNEMKRKSETR